MKTVENPTANKQLRRMLKDADGGTVVLTEKGKPFAALIPVEGMDGESLSLGTNPKFLRILRKSFRELDHGERISLAEMKERLSQK